MDLRKILSSFYRSRINGKKLQFEQRRSIFQYFKFEHQEKMDGSAKAYQAFKKVPRESVLAPKFRLRPFSMRFAPTETLEFLRDGKNMNTAIVSLIFIYAFVDLFRMRRGTEKILMDHYNPNPVLEVYVPTTPSNELDSHIVFDTLAGEHIKN